MDNVDIVLDYIKTFYQVSVIKNGEMIMFHDCIETPKTSQLHFIGNTSGFEIYLIWDKAQIYTDIDIFKKESAVAVHVFTQKLKNIQTHSFLKYLCENLNKSENIIKLNIKDVPEEFPSLFEEHEIFDNPRFTGDN